MRAGRFLKHLREDEGLSQLEWSLMFGVSESYVGRIERSLEVEMDKPFIGYIHEIQMRYDSEVLGSIVNGLIDYRTRRKTLLEVVEHHGIPLKNLILHCI